METLKAIFMEPVSDYKWMDIILKVWIATLMIMVVVGLAGLIWGIVSGEADLDNATFGIFDTLG